MKGTAEANIYVLHFDNKYDIETFGSITELINYLTKYKLTIDSKRSIRKKVVNAIENYKDFQLDYGGVKRDYFASKHKVEIECRIHS